MTYNSEIVFILTKADWDHCPAEKYIIIMET